MKRKWTSDQEGNPLYPPGIYRVKRKSSGVFRGGFHYGVYLIFPPYPPAVFERPYRGQTRRTTFQGWLSGKKEWWVEGHVAPAEIPRAIARLHFALTNPSEYHLLVNNCEHFANWVYDGKPSSRQVQQILAQIAVAAALRWILFD